MPAARISPQLAAALAMSGRTDTAAPSVQASADAAATGTPAPDAASPPASAAAGTAAATVTDPAATAVAAAAEGGTGTSGAAPGTPAPAAASAIATDDTGGGVSPALAAAAGHSELTTFLQGELRTAQTRTAELTVELNAANSTITQLNATVPGLETVVRQACERLAIGLGASTIDLKDMKGSALIERFTTLNTELSRKFPVGQQSRSDAAQLSNSAANVAQLPTARAAVAATNYPARNKAGSKTK